MTDRKSITVSGDAFDRADAHKQEDESWTDFWHRVADTLESQDEDVSTEPDTVVVENVDEIARASADKVENRMARR